MKEIEKYIESILSDLPLEEDEKAEIQEEFSAHLTDHVNELMIKGYSESDAASEAIKAFGKEAKLNWEMKKVMFPYYKVVRYFWNVAVVTGLLCLLSYSIMEYYNPQLMNSLPASSVITGMLLVALIAGVAEVLYEAVSDMFKAKWLKNPWLFFFVPALLIGGIQSFSLLENPGYYQDGLWIDLFSIPIGAFLYLLSRELFTFIFTREKKNKLTGLK